MGQVCRLATLMLSLSSLARTANNVVSAGNISHKDFPNDQPCLLLATGEALHMRCEWDTDRQMFWAHMPTGKTAHVVMPEGEHKKSLIDVEVKSKDQEEEQTAVSSMTVWNVTELDAGQYICVVSDSDVVYRTDVAVINVSTVAQPGCGGHVKFVFHGVNSPLQLTIYKVICRPYKAVETESTTHLNTKQIQLQFKMPPGTHSTVSCYFYIGSPSFACGSRILDATFEVNTVPEMCRMGFLQVSGSRTLTLKPLLMTVTTCIVISIY